MDKLKYSDILICLDSGHSETDTQGKETPKLPDGSRIKEHSFNRAVVQQIILLCKKYGIKYLETSPNPNKDMSLSDRISRINNEVKMNPSLKVVSVSVHCNASGKNTLSEDNPSGMEVFYMNPTNGSKELAECVYNEITKGTPQRKRGIKVAEFALLKPKCPSCLAEFLFMDSGEYRLMNNKSYIAESSEEVLQGILNYFKITKQEPIAQKPTITETPKEVVVVEQYKLDAVQWLIDNGYLTDKSWLEKADQPTPLYVDALITKRLHEKLTKK